MQALCQYVLPAALPGIWDVLGADGKMDPKPDDPRYKGRPAEELRAVARRRYARDARTKIICVVMAVWMVALSVRELWSAEGRDLMRPERMYDASPTSRTLTYSSCAYFVWDVLVCIMDGEGVGYHVHAWACLLTFFTGMQPFLSGWAPFVLMFEASTPFLHIRKVMIQAGAASGPLWGVVNAAFGLTFLVFRIIIGYPGFFIMDCMLVNLLASGAAHNTAVVCQFLLLSVVLGGLNAWWGWLIVKGAIGGNKPRTKPTASAVANKDASAAVVPDAARKDKAA